MARNHEIRSRKILFRANVPLRFVSSYTWYDCLPRRTMTQYGSAKHSLRGINLNFTQLVRANLFQQASPRVREKLEENVHPWENASSATSYCNTDLSYIFYLSFHGAGLGFFCASPSLLFWYGSVFRLLIRSLTPHHLPSTLSEPLEGNHRTGCVCSIWPRVSSAVFVWLSVDHRYR